DEGRSIHRGFRRLGQRAVSLAAGNERGENAGR
ncbi:MAG: hypothetical protein ACI9F9_002394, partial [Candidatus Paceibacteria bacterium]